MDKYKTIEDYLAGLDDTRRQQVQLLREYIRDAEPLLIENIKWNAPNYMLNDEDRITFNTQNKEQLVKLVFHMGATRKEDKKGEPVLNNASLIVWASDIRGNMTFSGLEEIKSNEKVIKQTVREWLALN